MAAPKGAYEDREKRRAQMVTMHKRGMSNGAIGRVFGIHKNSVRQILIRALGLNK
jgi:hypothetical protein